MRPEGSQSVIARSVTGTSLRLLLIQKVRVLTSPDRMVGGEKFFVNAGGGGGRTVSSASAGYESPREELKWIIPEENIVVSVTGKLVTANCAVHEVPAATLPPK